MKPFRQAFWLSKNTSGSTVLSQTTPAHLLHYSALCNTSGRGSGSGKHQMRTAQIENKWRAGRGKRNSQKNSEKRKRNVLQFLPVGFSFGILAQLRLLAIASLPLPAPLFMQPIRERGQLACLLTHNSLRVTFWKNSGADAGTSPGTGNGDGDAGPDLCLKTAQRMPNVLRLGLLNDCQAMINCRTNLIKVYGQLHSSTSSPFPLHFAFHNFLSSFTWLAQFMCQESRARRGVRAGLQSNDSHKLPR